MCCFFQWVVQLFEPGTRLACPGACQTTQGCCAHRLWHSGNSRKGTKTDIPAMEQFSFPPHHPFLQTPANLRTRAKPLYNPLVAIQCATATHLNYTTRYPPQRVPLYGKTERFPKTRLVVAASVPLALFMWMVMGYAISYKQR